MEMGARLRRQGVDVTHPVDIDRLIVGQGGPLEIGAGGQMKDGGHRLGQRPVGLRGKAKTRLGDIALQVRATGARQQVAVPGRSAAEHLHLPAHGEQRGHQRPADHTGAAGDQHTPADHLITWRAACCCHWAKLAAVCKAVGIASTR